MLINFISILHSKKLFLLLIVAFLYHESSAQIPKDYDASVEMQAIGTTNGAVPFWMRANQFGSVPLSGASGSIIGRFSKDYEKISIIDNVNKKKKIVDWGFGFEGRANAGKKSNLQIIEAYAKGKFSIFQLKIGRTKDVMGLNGDTALSSGNFAVSGNALGIPKVEISIPNYYPLPIFDGLFSFKGSFSHGWVGKTNIISEILSIPPDKGVYPMLNTSPTTYIHQKSLYGRLGRPNWKIKIYGGINHQVYWGSEAKTFGPNFKLSPIETMFYVATGKTYGNKGVPSSKIGNQIGSIDFGFEYDLNKITLTAYRQNFYDVGALSKLANIKDGLNGLALKNKKQDFKNSIFHWDVILFELFYSKDQAGYPWSKPTKSGDEDYYNNFFYKQGWSYKNTGLGTPLITTKNESKPGQALSVYDYFINNRVLALHFGLRGRLYDWQFKTKATYSKNYGTFGTSIYGNSTGAIRNPQDTNIFTPVNQFSFGLDVMRTLKKGYSVGFSTAIDNGNLLNNSIGLAGVIKKTF